MMVIGVPIGLKQSLCLGSCSSKDTTPCYCAAHHALAMGWGVVKADIGLDEAATV
jgi:hypothetical protein